MSLLNVLFVSIYVVFLLILSTNMIYFNTTYLDKKYYYSNHISNNIYNYIVIIKYVIILKNIFKHLLINHF